MSDKVTYYILRHGDTKLNDSNVFRGMLDPPLNEEGILDAHKAAEFLSRQEIGRIICSPLLRAVQTAKIVAGCLGGRHVCQCRELFPWQVPEIAGKDRDKHSHILDKYIDNPDEVPKDGESLNQFIERVGDFFEDSLKECIPTLYVCHTSNIVALNDLINGEDAGRPESGEVVGPGGICVVNCTGDEYHIEPVFGEEKPAEFGS